MEPRQWSTSLRTRLGVIASIFLLVVMIAVGLSALMLRSWDGTLAERSRARVAADEVAELRLAFSDQETGVRGYQLSGQVAFLEPYDSGQVDAEVTADRLRDWGQDDPGFVATLDRAIAAGERWDREVARPTIDDVQHAPDGNVGRERFDELRSELDGLADLVDDELTRLDDRAADLRRSVFVVLGASAAVAIAGTALAAMLFRRWIVRPLHRVGVAARALAEDDTYPLPRFDSPELQDVSDAVGSLQQSLKVARDEAVAAYQGLEQSAVLAIHVRTELANEIGQMPDGWVAESMLVPAEGVVAGDCFDAGLLDADHLYVVMIDVTGHGAVAALDALKAKSQIRASIRRRRDPGAALDWLSSEMLQSEQSDLLTAMVLVIELSTGRIRYANAGHPPGIVTDGATVVELPPTGPLVGAFTATWRTERAELQPGWTLLVHTDGITDTIGADRDRFGNERLRDCLVDPDPDVLLTRIRSETEAFRTGPRSDDTTAIAIHRYRHEADDAQTDDPGAHDGVPSRGDDVGTDVAVRAAHAAGEPQAAATVLP